MPSPLEVLQKRRASQLSQMAGGEETYSAEQAKKDARKASKTLPQAPKEPVSKASTKLLFTRHASLRMSQLGVQVPDVYAIVKYGETSHQHDGRILYQILRKSEPPKNLEHLGGVGVVLSNKAGRPRVITILNYGGKKMRR